MDYIIGLDSINISLIFLPCNGGLFSVSGLRTFLTNYRKSLTGIFRIFVTET